MDNPSVDEIDSAHEVADAPPVAIAGAVAGTERANAGPVDNPAVVVNPDPKTKTQVVIAETKVVQGTQPIVDRVQAPPKTTTNLGNGTIRQDW